MIQVVTNGHGFHQVLTLTLHRMMPRRPRMLLVPPLVPGVTFNHPTANGLEKDVVSDPQDDP